MPFSGIVHLLNRYPSLDLETFCTILLVTPKPEFNEEALNYLMEKFEFCKISYVCDAASVKT